MNLSLRTISTLCTPFNQESSRQLRIHSIPKSLPDKALLITRIRYPKNHAARCILLLLCQIHQLRPQPCWKDQAVHLHIEGLYLDGLSIGQTARMHRFPGYKPCTTPPWQASRHGLVELEKMLAPRIRLIAWSSEQLSQILLYWQVCLQSNHQHLQKLPSWTREEHRKGQIP